MVLVLAPQVHHDVVGQLAQDAREPRGQGVGVHGDGEPDDAAGVRGQGAPGLRLQERELAGEPHEDLARGRGQAGAHAADEHLARALLERLDPLADRGRRHVEHARGRVEAPVLDHCGERGELLPVQFHVSHANDAEER